MRFLADESCDMAVVRALLELGHDVARVSERGAGLKDILVAKLVLFRFPRHARAAIGAAAATAVRELGERLHAAFVVVEPGRFRIAELKP